MRPYRWCLAALCLSSLVGLAACHDRDDKVRVHHVGDEPKPQRHTNVDVRVEVGRREPVYAEPAPPPEVVEEPAPVIVEEPAPVVVERKPVIIVREAPPPIIVERRPAPPRGADFWIEGYWNHDGHKHVWVKGHYERSRPGHKYVPPRWKHEKKGWEFHAGYWR